MASLLQSRGLTVLLQHQDSQILKISLTLFLDLHILEGFMHFSQSLKLAGHIGPCAKFFIDYFSDYTPARPSLKAIENWSLSKFQRWILNLIKTNEQAVQIYDCSIKTVCHKGIETYYCVVLCTKKLGILLSILKQTPMQEFCFHILIQCLIAYLIGCS